MKLLIIANWKCNPITLQGAKLLFDAIAKGIKKIKNAEVIICPPFIYISNLKSQISKLKLGAQDVFWEEKGAYTGEISPKMLKDLGIEYVIIGHSERRRHFQETDEMINKKIKAALQKRLKPILCIENIAQIKKDLKGVSDKELKNIILAYEPVFAIGTRKPCTIEKARKTNISISRIVRGKIPVLYGGSVSSKNAADYIQKAGSQGLLIGDASLNAREFVKIIKNIDLISKNR